MLGKIVTQWQALQPIAQHFAPQATFWYTITPGLNDQPHSLFFALARFLQHQGASSLWSQLVADKGEIKQALAINLLRHDLATLANRPSLLCFDEIDLLRPTEIEAHTQLLPLLETLRGLAPMLWIGQKVSIAADEQVQVIGLSPDLVVQLLQHASIALSTAEVIQLHAYTQGNPRLLELFIAFHRLLDRAGATTSDVLNTFAQQPSLEFLLRRIWLHLNETEKYLLELLSVFRNATPRSAWNDQAQQSALDQLLDWHLVQCDGRGGVRLLPALRDGIYQTLLGSEERELLHLEAGGLRAQYGQYTAAAHHYAAAGNVEAAIDLLHSHKEQEIDQGQAEAALTVLKGISQRNLASESQQKLTLLRAELQKLLGHYDAARTTLQSTYWNIPFLEAQRWRLDGDIAELRGETSQAQSAYHKGLALIERLLSEAAYFHRDLGYLYANDVAFEQADNKVMRLRHEAANLEGFICEMRGDLKGAEHAYAEAYQWAQRCSYLYGEANTRNNLGRVYAWQRQLELAEAHLQQAIEFFRDTSRLGKLASATYNLALARRLSERFESAVTPAEEALNHFDQLGEE